MKKRLNLVQTSDELKCRERQVGKTSTHMHSIVSHVVVHQNGCMFYKMRVCVCARPYRLLFIVYCAFHLYFSIPITVHRKM